MDTMTDYLRDAISLAGGVSALAKALNVTKGAVSQWQEPGRKAPAKHCVAIERLTGISRHKLRPDIFGREERKEVKPPPSPKNGVPRHDQRAA
jgi:DNA-binding transcriptional regulator YdaS (Cro superfamily)